MLATTTAPVSDQTSPEINDRIRRRTDANVARYAGAGPREIGRRLGELDREWDIERSLEANASTLAFVGCALAVTTDRRWAFLPLVVTGFLFQHALQGWCPPLPILRRMGFRTAREIAHERYALKALRGDFRDVPADAGSSAGRASAAVAAARR